LRCVFVHVFPFFCFFGFVFLLVLFSFVVYPPLVSFSFSLFDFINVVCGLRWLCREGIVAYYVECANVIKNWNGSDCVNRGYQGRRGWVFKLLSAHSTVRLVWTRI